ncbi:MAG: tRNA 2-selenouridine(34) synthase MnmH [Syntrophomonadaceae bacterium]|nr:tRNA 2-selenouridine(34) synthase MnmH [Syntrophomonadaceae bacterium]
MKREVDIEEALQLENVLFVDLRSESEFREATIPGAVNLPLFDDQERARLGQVYRQAGPSAARYLGLEISAPKLPLLIKQISEFTRKQPVVLFCWRGGMRSASIDAVCQLMGIPSRRLVDGYKSYRRRVYRYLWQTPVKREAVVLHGLTGVGKTELLHELQRIGLPAVDLEGMAGNRGSVFGGINLPDAPGQKMFEALLADKMWSTEQYPFFLVECESRRLGKVNLPSPLLESMQKGRKVLLYDTLENRVQRLIKVYAEDGEKNQEQILRALGCLKERLGGEKVKLLQDRFLEREFEEFVSTLLVEYYDPIYRYPSHPDPGYDLCIDTGNLEAALVRLKEYLARIYGFTFKKEGGEGAGNR